MRQGFNRITGLFHRLTGRFVIEKKKAVLALCLITLMIFMWVRVLRNQTPQIADTLLTPQSVTGDNAVQASNVSFVELPKIKGRNDRLTRDFFTVENWQNFLSGEEAQGAANVSRSNASFDSREETSRRIAEKLRLEVIDWGENPQAFINNKLLSAGNKLTVSDGGKLYECEVVKIGKDMVLMKCGEVEIRLKLAQTAEVTDRAVKQ
jgi:hypothetical protein